MSVDILDLKKTFELNLEKKSFPDIPVMSTRFAGDKSGSMHRLFTNGFVDHMIARFFAAAMKFDDDHTLEVGFFNETFRVAPPISEMPSIPYTDYYGIVADGGTDFAHALRSFTEQKPGLVGKLSRFFHQPTLKAYLGFVTDGENSDRDDVIKVLSNVDPARNFIQFIGIGNQVDTSYLQGLADTYPFVDFIHFPNPTSVDDNQFYEAICNDKFKAWIEANS
jgi:hypothetical protein